MENKKCLLCHKKLYSELGKGCMLCGMALEDKSKEFCSKMCRIRYKQIHKNKNPGGCWPGYLPGHIEGENLLITESDLKESKFKSTSNKEGLCEI